MEVLRWRSASAAERWKGQAHQSATGVVRIPATQPQPLNWSAGTIDSASTGTDSTIATSMRPTSGSRPGDRGALPVSGVAA